MFFLSAHTRFLHPENPILLRTCISYRRSTPPLQPSSSSILSSKRLFMSTRVHLGISSNTSQTPSRNQFFSSETILLFTYFLVFFILRFLSTVLPPNFPERWHRLLVFAEEAEVRATDYPSHLLKAVVAYEDRRFYKHCGVDPVGIARAVLLFPSGGGGSTITQQLVKNIFLKNERTFSRKAVEILLALILERKLSKSKILNSYLNKLKVFRFSRSSEQLISEIDASLSSAVLILIIYWGHGIYGIQSASSYYFGKNTSLLSLGESALLAGIIPAPELRSPFNDPSRGKSSQARALRRMVDGGFLDIEAAISVVNQPLYLCGDNPEHQNSLQYSPLQKLGCCCRCDCTSVKHIWDWEKESMFWEVREEMARWAIRMQKKYYSNHFIFSVKSS